MYRRLVDTDQIALDVSPSLDSAFDPTVVVINAQPKQGIAPEKCETAIYEELDRVKKDLVYRSRAGKSAQCRLAEFYRQMRTISGRANTIGIYDVFHGDYRKLFDAVKNYNAVTRDDLQRVAAKYFGANNRTVATLIPENAESPAARERHAR